MKDWDHLYADSAQAREADQRRSRPLDQWGNPVQLASDFCHDYDAPGENSAVCSAREKEGRVKLKIRLERAMTKMEAFFNGSKA